MKNNGKSSKPIIAAHSTDTGKNPAKPGIGKTTGAKARGSRVSKGDAIRLQVLERISDGILAFDVQMNHVYVDERAGELLRREAQDLVGKSFWEAYPESARAPFADACQRAFETQTVVPFDGYFPSSNTWFEGRIYPSSDGLSVLISDRGLPEQEEVLRSLEETEEKFSKTFHSSPIAKLIVRIHDGKVLDTNEKFLKLFGFERSQVVGETSTEPSMEFSEWKQALADTLQQQGNIHEHEVAIHDASGELHYLLLSGEKMEIEHEACVLIACMDVTERKKAEEEIREISEFPLQNPNPVMRFRQDGELLYANPSSTPLLNSWTQADRTLTPPHKLQELLSAVIESGSEKETELTHEEKIYSCLLVPVHGADYVNLYFSDITSRKQTQESLQALIHQTTTGITRADLNGRFVFVNQAFCDMLGYSEQELIGKTMWELNHPDDIAKNKRLFERLIAEGESYQLEKRLIRHNGSVLWVNVGTSPLRDARGRTHAAVSVIVDITRRKRAEESLMDGARHTLYLSTLSDLLRPLSDPAQIEMEATRILGMHLKASQVAYADIKADGTATVRNCYSETAATELRGEFNIRQYIPAQVMPRFRAGRAFVTAGEANASRNSEALTASKERAPVQAQIVIPLIRDGELVAALFVQQLQRREWRNEEVHLVEETAERMQTAIERSRAEAEQREADQRFRILSDTVPSMVWSTAPDGSIRYLNQYWHNYTGLTTEETITNWAKQTLHPDDYGRYTALWERALQTKPDEYVDEARYRRYDGEYRWFQSRAIPARDEHGNVTAWYGVTTDIHDRVEQQAELVKVINNTPFMLTRCSRDLRYGFVSRTYAEMIGRTPEDVGGKPIVEIMGEEGFKTILPYVEQVLQGKRVEFEAKIPFAGIGSPILHVVFAPDYDEQGNVIGWFASLNDVTARKAAEKEKQQLLEQEQLLRAQAEQSKAEAERASAKAEQELSQRKLAEAALGVWTDTPLPQVSRPAWLKYGVAVAVTAVALLLRGALSPLLGDSLPLVTLYGAVAFSVWYGGVGPALLSILIGYAGATWFFMEPVHAFLFGVENVTGVIVFLLSSAIIVYLGYTMRRAQRHAHESARVAVERQRQAEFRLLMQKHAEDALRESERKFSLIYHKLPFIAALSKLPDGMVVDINEQFERAFGYSKEEAIGKTSLELGINPDSEARQRMLNEIQRTGSAHNIEMELVTRSAGKRIFLSNIDKVSLEGEDYILNTIQDITERRLMEQQVRRSEEKYRRIVETANEGIWEIDANTHTTFVNPRMAEMLGCTVEEMLGRSRFEFILSEDNELGEDRLERAKRGIPGRSNEFRYRRKDGSILWTLASSSPQLDEQGNFLGSIALIMDITERKESERALAEYARQQTALYQFSDQLQRVGSRDEIYNAALDTIINALHCDRASILLADEKGIMHFTAWRGLSEKYRQITDGHSPWAINAKQPKPVYYDDVEPSDIGEELKSVIRAEGIHALAFIPLVSNGKLIGKFMTYFNSPHPFSESEIDFSLTIARQLTFGIDRQRAEQNLRVSEDRLRLAVAAANIGIWDIDLRRRDRAWSKEGKAIYGLAEHEYLDFERQLQLTHPDDRAYVDEMVKAFRDEGTTKQLNLEHRIVRPDGALRWVEVRGEAVYEQDPLPIRLIGTIIDITERKRMEEQLAESNRKLSQILSSIQDDFYVLDRDWKFVYASPLFTAKVGKEPQDFVGKSIWEMFPKHVGTIFEENLRAAMEKREVRRFETGGKYTNAWYRMTVFPSEEGITVLGTDVTERKRAADALRQSEERFAQFMQHLPGLAWIKDMEGRYVFANAAAEKAFKTPPEQLYGKTDVDIFPPEVATQYQENDQRALLEGKGIQVVETLQQDDGLLHYSLVTKFPIPGPDGNIAMIGGTAFDITEQKQAEEAARIENERFMRFIDSNIVGIVIGEASGKILLANDYYLNLLGVTRQDFLEQKVDWKKLTPPEWLPADEKAIRELQERGVCEPYEKEYVRPDGTRVPVYIANAILPGPKREIAAFVLDMTERKRAENRLTLLAEISELTRRFEDPVELMASVAQAVGEHFQVKRCLFNEIDLDHDLEIVHRDYHHGSESVEGSHKITDYSSITTAEMMAGKTIVNHDSKTDPRTASDYERSYLPTGERTYVAVPLMRDDRWVASLWISDDTPRQWGKEDVSLLETIAERTWTATEKLRIDAALRESQQRLSLTYSHAAIGLVETTPDTRILECNNTFSKIVGYSRDQLLDRSFLDTTYQEDAKIEEVLYRQLMNKQIPFYRIEKRYVKQDGSLTWVEMVRSVVLDGNGKPRFGIGAVFDINERKQREEALRARTEEIETLMEVSPIGILVAHDPECRHITGNPAAYALLGFPTDSEDNLSKSGPEPMNPSHRVFRDGVELAVDELPMQKSAKFGLEIEEETLELRFEDGTQKYIYFFTKPLFDPQGRTRGTVAAVLDITERRRNEEALKAARERAEEAASRIARLQQVTTALSGPLTLSQVAEIVVTEGVPALGAAVGTMMDLSPDGETLMIRYSTIAPAFVEHFKHSPLTLKTPATDAVQSGAVVWIETREQYLERYPHLADQISRWGYQAALSIPLEYKGYTIGVLNMSFDSIKPYNREDEEYALTLARQAAQALERAKAEESLRASEERYRAIINQTTVGIVRKDGDGNILFVNQAFGEMLGYASSELIDMSMWQLTHPDDVAKNRQLYDRMMIDGLPFRIEKRLLHRDGSIIWTLVSVSPLLDAEGKPQSAVSVYSDITLRKYAESELHRLNVELEDRVRLRTAQLQAANESLLESEATARLIIESMPDGIVIINKQGQVVYCNSQVEMLFGYKPTEVLGQSVTKLIPERYQPVLGVERELFGRRKDETQFPADVLVSPISSRTTWDRMITIRDTTEQRLAQEAIRKNEEKLRSLFEVLPVGISFLDNQGNITEMNSTLTQILGLSKVEVAAGKFRPRHYIRADGTPMPSSELANVRAREEQRTVYNIETGIIKENGQIIWTSVNAAPVDVADVDVVVATIDITERKKVEDELHRSRERLRVLSRRLVEVQEEERHAIARELHDRVGQNLAALNLNLNILRSQLSADALQVIGTRLSDSVTLVNQILGITRNVMADLRSDVLDEYGLESAVREYADQFTQRTGIQVVSDKSSTAIPRMDPGVEMTLLRIAQEALTNVARHAKANRATISISADEEAVHMSIQDDGIGILSWQKANQPGSHGLRIIRERAEAFGGSVQVHSAYKKGTSIEVKIPLARSSYKSPREKRS